VRSGSAPDSAEEGEVKRTTLIVPVRVHGMVLRKIEQREPEHGEVR